MIFIILYVLIVFFLAGLIWKNEDGTNAWIWLWKNKGNAGYWLIFLLWTGAMVVAASSELKKYKPCVTCTECPTCPACPNEADKLMAYIKLQNKVDNFLIEHKRERKHFE